MEGAGGIPVIECDAHATTQSPGICRVAQHEPPDPSRPAHLFFRSIVDAAPPVLLVSEMVAGGLAEISCVQGSARAR